MIILCAGGTGGHVFPAEGLAACLKERGHKLALLTDSRAMHFVNYEYFDSIEVLNVSRSNIFVYLFTMIKSTIKAFFFIRKHKVKAVVGFGGYPSLPGMLAGILAFKKILIHEQNAVLGRANKLLNYFAKGIAISFHPTIGAPDTAKLTGNPVRKIVQQAIASPESKDPNKFHICVIGGSQGARLFSNILPRTIEMLPEELQKEIFVTQQCRVEQLEDVQKLYDSMNVQCSLENFFSDLPMTLRSVDLAICRSGASTVAELTCLGVPAIFVPLAISKDNDQGENAKLIVSAGGAWILKESELTPPALALLIESAMRNRKILKAMGESIRQLARPNADQDLANWVETFTQDSYL